jgi:hypothetical protein
MTQRSASLTVKTLKPRNPFVAASFRAPAGAHRSAKPRQHAQRSLRQELARLDHERHHT